MITFASMQELIDEAKSSNKSISKITLEQSALDQEIPEQEVYDKMYAHYKTMKESIKDGLSPDLKSNSGLVGGFAHKVKFNAQSGKSISGDFLSGVIYNSLAVIELNASMGKIVAAPTAGSCGVLPGCLFTLQTHYDLTDDEIVMGLFNASALGMVIANNATLAGAEGGCQAEIGSAAAMAASAMTELMGGSPEQCGHAAAHVLKSLLGLVCDPVAGLVEEPCVIRNPTSAAVAVTSTELALAGVESIIPIDEVIQIVNIIGKQLPASLRETSDGGLAISKTGLAINKRLASQ